MAAWTRATTLWAACLSLLTLNGASTLQDKDFEFISLWTNIPVDLLKSYQFRIGDQNLNRDLTVQSFRQKEPSWPLNLKLAKLRSLDVPSTSEKGPDLRVPVDPLLAVYKPRQLQLAFKTAGSLASQEFLANASSRHLSHGQAKVLVDSLLAANVSEVVPKDYLFTLPSHQMYTESQTSLDGVLVDAKRMFPSQRHALFKRLVGQDGENLGPLIRDVLKLDLADEMLKYVTPEDFRKNIQAIRTQLKSLSEEEQLNAVYFPDALLTLWQEDIASSSAMLATHTQLTLRGMSCASVKVPDAKKIPEIASAYNDYVLAKHPDRLKTVPISLRRCFAERVREYLSEKSDAGSKSNFMTKLTVPDAKMIGGTFLSSFSLAEIRQIEDRNVFEEVIRAIGGVPLAELMPLTHSFKLKNLTDLAIATKTDLTLGDLNWLGTLAFFLHPDKWTTIKPADIREFVSKSLDLPHHKCLCLPKIYLEGLGKAIVRGFGPPQDLKPSDLVDIDELLVALDASAMEKVNVKSMLSALPYLLKNRTFHDRHYDKFPGFIGPVGFVQACSYWLDSVEDSDNYEEADRRLSRTYLLASQLSVDLALAPPTKVQKRSLLDGSRWSFQVNAKVGLHEEELPGLFHFRLKRQVTGSSSFKTPDKEDLLEKLEAYLAEHPPSSKQSQAINAARVFSESQTTSFSISKLGVDVLSSEEKELEKAKELILKKALRHEQITEVFAFKETMDMNYVQFVVKSLNLTASDLGVDPRYFCKVVNKTNCDQIPVSKPSSPGLKVTDEECALILKNTPKGKMGRTSSNSKLEVNFYRFLKCFNILKENKQLGRDLSMNTDVIFVESLSSNLSDVLAKKKLDGKLTTEMNLLLVQVNQDASNRLTQKVLEVLKITNVPNDVSVDEYASTELRKRTLTDAESDQLGSFANEQMMEVSKRVIEIAKLTAEDLGVNPAALCRILDVCPQGEFFRLIFESFASSRKLGRDLNADVAFVGGLNDKLNEIIDKKKSAGNVTQAMNLLLVQVNQDASSRLTQKVLNVFNISQVPNDTSPEEYASLQLRKRNLTEAESDQFTSFADAEMRNLTKRVIEIAKLTAEDFGVQPDDLCRILGVCPPKAATPSAVTPSTTSTVASSTTAATTSTTLTTSTTTVTTTSLPLPPLVIDIPDSPNFAVGFKLTSEVVKFPTRIGCDGVLTAGPAASSLQPSDLDLWSEFEILDCLEVLGNVEWANEVKGKVVDTILTKTNNLEKVMNSPKFVMLQLKYLLDPLIMKKPELFTFDLPSAVEPVSALGELVLSQEVITSVASKIIKDNRLDEKESYDKPTLFHLLSLNQFLCGFPLKVIDRMFKSSNDSRCLLNCMGAIRLCKSPEILSFLAEKAVSVIATPWKASDVKSLGVIVAGLPPAKLAALNESLGALTDTAIAHLTPEYFNVLTADHLNMMTPESLSVLSLHQLPKEGSSVLDSGQLAYIEECSMNNRQSSLLSKIYKSRLVPQAAQIQAQPQHTVAPVQERQGSETASPIKSHACLSGTASAASLFLSIVLAYIIV